MSRHYSLEIGRQGNGDFALVVEGPNYSLRLYLRNERRRREIRERYSVKLPPGGWPVGSRGDA